MAPFVSLCMIVKNEEEELALALDSARPIVDEMIVYDTGSTDDTVSIARAHGARVVEGYWDDDFSRARNAALDLCSGTWILWLDADESAHGDPAAIRRALAAAPPEADGFSVPIEILEGNGLVGHGAFLALRLFRRLACRFEGRLHEQVLRPDEPREPRTLPINDLRILHRGYIGASFADGSKYERNLRIAELEMADPDADRATALYNYGRTLMLGPEPLEGLEFLEEAVTTSRRPTVRRYALQTMCTLFTNLARYDEALETVERLRAASTRPVTSDLFETRVHLARGDWQRVLDVSERMPYIDNDDDGVETGRYQVASLRARALSELGRPGEAADELLDALRSHGVLDEPLPVLVAYLLAAGRQLGELAQAVRPEIVPVLAGAAAALPAAQADVVLTALHERLPERLEPIALAAKLAPRLPVTRALWWSAELRRAGHAQHCPLVAISGNDELEPLVRLRAAAAAFDTFGEQRVVETARGVVQALGDEDRLAALADVRCISAALADLLSPANETVAILLSLDGEARDGYFAVTPRPDAAPATTAAPDRLPFSAGGAHLLHVRNVLAALPPAEIGFALDEWLRVLTPGGELVVEVPDALAAARRLAHSDEAQNPGPEHPLHAEQAALRSLYGPRRYGARGEEEAFRTAWTRRSLTRQLSDHGFAVESVNEVAGALSVRARAMTLLTRLAAGPRPEVSVVAVTEHGAQALRRCLEAVAGQPAGAAYEVVCLDNDADSSTAAFVDSLAGAATVLRSPARLAPSAAFNLASRFATGSVLVLLSDEVALPEGWAATIVAALADPAVSAVTAALLDDEGELCGGGLALSGEATTPRLEHRPAVGSDVEAIGPGCVAMRIETWRALQGMSGGLSAGDAVIDLSLRARNVGSLRVVESLEATLAHDGGAAPEADPDERIVAASATELAHRWAGQLRLRPPVARRVTAASLLPSTTLLERINTATGIVVGAPRTGGCNLVGDFSAVGPESGRVMAWAGALSEIGLPCSRLGFTSGRLDAGLDEAETLPYDTTLLCLAGEDLVEYVSRAGLDALRGRYTILDWHWPFAAPAPANVGEASMVGEIWVPSRFTQRALREVTARPLRLQPVPVMPAEASLDRSDLGMPAGFLFATLAEVGRGRPGEVALANPVGVVESFCTAFEEAAGPSLFVALCGSRTEATAEACREAARGRADVIVAERLPEGGVDSVLALADCYVSLHRSSSFSVALARALVTGRPVVATRVGGPLEYLDESVADLVGVSPATTSLAHPPYPAGLEWGEPDLEDAAAALWNVYDDPAAARARSQLGALRLGRSHAAALAGRMMRARIEAVAPLRPQWPQAHRGRRRARR
ncbi:MAG TPA: glycosyltransferase [Acidimicrobiales bacterium]|nr:glycosyltransferase [Acidimicrobiales bacterium]